MDNIKKVSFDSLENNNSPIIIESFGDINIYAITRGNFQQITDTIRGLYVEENPSENAVFERQVKMVKDIFPILTNVDMSKVTNAKIKKILQNSSKQMNNVIIFIMKYLSEFMDDFVKFNEMLSGLPKKDFDLIVKSERNPEKIVEVFEKNGLMVKDEAGLYQPKDKFLKEFTDKYLG